MTEAELEGIILRNEPSNNEARFVLGKLMVEGTSDKVKKNENKGLNWLKEAIKRGHMPSLEYKTYWDIRFDKQPKLQQIRENLDKIIEANKSCRACNTLAELNHASAGSQLAKMNEEYAATAAQNRDNAAKYYLMSAEQGDVIGLHWMGVFYHEGFGVSKNLDKAIEYLTRAADMGNGQSYF
jgi:TPR repeat protein